MFVSPRSVAASAFRSGGLSSAVFTASYRSPSGWVCRCTFRSRAAAARFARSAAGRAGSPVSVRGVVVSVVVWPRGSRPAGAGRWVSAAGGVVPFWRSLGAAGWSSVRFA